MRVPLSRRRARWEFNMTPMIDIVFLLIIFFLVSSHLAKQESQLPLPLPSADSGDTPQNSLETRITVNVTAGGELRLGSNVVGVDELERRLKHETTRVGQDIEVRLRTDRSVSYRYVSPVLAACARTGIWNITFSVFRSTEVPR